MKENNWKFYDDIGNVFTNVTPPKKSQAHLFERDYLNNILMKLRSWEDFLDYNYYLIDSRRQHSFKFDKKSIVFYLSNEDGRLRENLDRALIVFTSYMPTKKDSANIYPIPLGVNGSVPTFPIKNYDKREIDVFFSGNLHRRRIMFFMFSSWVKFSNRLRLALGMKGLNLMIQFTKRFSAGLDPYSYGKVLSNSKVALTPEGYVSNNSFRFFEACRAGCIVISCKQSNDWYYEKFPGFFVDEWWELSKLLKKIKENPEFAKNIQQEMLEYYNNFCSEEAVANFIKSRIISIDS